MRFAPICIAGTSRVDGQANQQWAFVSIGDGYYYIVNHLSGKVLDDTGWSTTDGTNIQQWTQEAGQANQEWSIIAAQ